MRLVSRTLNGLNNFEIVLAVLCYHILLKDFVGLLQIDRFCRIETAHFKT